MDWVRRMNSALDYVECNLASEIDMYTVAQMACCSSSTFRKCSHSLQVYHLLST